MTKNAVHHGPDGHGFYGAVTVGERGQISIPAQARRDLGIEPGDKLLALVSPQGIAFVKAEALMTQLMGQAQGTSTLIDLVRAHSDDPGQAGGRPTDLDDEENE